MRNITRRLLWLFVFTVPWDVVPLPGVGALSRVVGLATLGVAMLTTLLEGRMRKPGLIFGLASLYVVLTALSLVWTISYPDTFQRAWTSVQVLGSIWVVAEFARTQEDQESLLAAFCLGEMIPLGGVLDSFRSGTSRLANRYTAIGLNLDDIGLTLVMGIPIAWHLMMNYSGAYKRTVRTIGLVYFLVAPVGTLLTGTRGALLSGLIALSLVPLTLFHRRSMRSLAIVAGLTVVVGIAAASVVPERTWARLFTIKSEVMDDGALNGRSDIWKAGLTVFHDRPLLGAGAAAYGAAVERLMNKRSAPHNMPVGLLVEQGIVGIIVYFSLLGACGLAIYRMPPVERNLWGVMLMTWLVGLMSLNWEYRKITWIMFGFIAAQRGIDRVSARLSAPTGSLAGASSDRPSAYRPFASGGQASPSLASRQS